MSKEGSSLLAALLLAGCADDDCGAGRGDDRAAARVTGTVAYRERIALPPSAVIKGAAGRCFARRTRRPS